LKLRIILPSVCFGFFIKGEFALFPSGISLCPEAI
jgi:hypothetical protein